jgi:hypothetical protein
LSGCVNRRNFRSWAGDNPRQLHERQTLFFLTVN